MQEMTELPPQDLGPFTSFYKMVVPQFKFFPWRSASIIAIISSMFLYLFLGATLVRLVSILQFGF